MRKAKHREKRALSPRSQRQLGKVTGTRHSDGLCPSAPCVFPSDAAFLAREKAKADAECYTAMKIAEANKVRAGRLVKRGVSESASVV